MPNEELGWVAIVHPYHPLRGREFPILKARRVAGFDTVILGGTEGGSFAVPLAWTDRALPSPWEALGKKPPCLSAPLLWALVEVVESLSQQDELESDA